MEDFQKFVQDPRFAKLSEADKPKAIQAFHTTLAEQNPDRASTIKTQGDLLGQLYTYRSQAEQGASIHSEDNKKLAELTHQQIINNEAHGRGEVTDSEAIQRDIGLRVESIGSQNNLQESTADDRRELARLYLLSGKGGDDLKALTGSEKHATEYATLLESVKSKGITEEQVAGDVNVYQNNFEGDFATDSAGNIVPNYSVFYNDRDTIINKVNSSDLNKLKKEEFIEGIDERRDTFAKQQLDQMDKAVKAIATGRYSLGLIQDEEAYQKIIEGGARASMQGDTDTEKLEIYTKALRGTGNFFVGAENVVGDVSSLNKGSNSTLAGLLSLNPLRLVSEDVDDANTEIQRTLGEARDGYSFIQNLNAGITDLDGSLIYKAASSLGEVAPTLALMAATGGAVGGGLRAGAARLGGGRVSQALAGSFGATLPIGLTTYNDILTESKNSKDPEVRARAQEFAFKGAAVEQLVTTAFSAIPGFAGVEGIANKSLGSLVKGAGGKQAVLSSMQKTIQNLNAKGGLVLSNTIGEVAEESTIALLNSYLVEADKNPNFTYGQFKESIADAASTSAVLGGMFGTRSQIDATVNFHRDQQSKVTTESTNSELKAKADVEAAKMENPTVQAAEEVKATVNTTDPDAREQAAQNITRLEAKLNEEGSLTEEDAVKLEDANKVLGREVEEVKDAPVVEEESAKAPSEVSAATAKAQKRAGDAYDVTEKDGKTTVTHKETGEEIFNDDLSVVAQNERFGRVIYNDIYDRQKAQEEITETIVEEDIAPNKVVDDAADQVSETDNHIDNDATQFVTKDDIVAPEIREDADSQKTVAKKGMVEPEHVADMTSTTRDDGSSEESDSIAKGRGLVKVWRARTDGGRTLTPREGYQLTFSTREKVAASYSVNAEVDAFYVNPEDFAEMESKDGSFSFTAFDRAGSSAPTRLTKVYDPGPQSHVKQTDPDMLYTYSSDIYGAPDATHITSPTDLTGTDTATVVESAAKVMSDPKFVEESTVVEFTDIGIVSGDIAPTTEGVARTPALNEADTNGYANAVSLQIKAAENILPAETIQDYTRRLEEATTKEEVEDIDDDLFIELKALEQDKAIERDIKKGKPAPESKDTSTAQERISEKVSEISTRNDDTKAEAKASNSYGKRGIPKRFFTDTPNEALVDDLVNWIDNKQEAFDNYSEKDDVDLNVEDIRQAELDAAQELVEAYESEVEVDETTGTTKYYGGLAILDPELIISTMKSLWKAGMTVAEFSKKALVKMGAGIRPALKAFHNLFQAKDGDVTVDDLDDKQSIDDAEFLTEEEEAQADEALGFAESGKSHPSSTRKQRVKLSDELSRAEEKEIANASLKSGISNVRFRMLDKILGTTFLGKGISLRNVQDKQFYGAAMVAWHWAKSAARPRARATAGQLRAFYADVVRVDKNGDMIGVKTRHEGQSLKPSDVIEQLMENEYSYDVDDTMREFVADWKRVLDDTLLRLEKNGLAPSFLKTEDGKFDYSKLGSNFYFPRGRVTETDGTSSSFFGTGSRPTSKLRSSNERAYDTEQDGADPEKGNLTYIDDPFARIEEFLADANSRIADYRLATDPDIVAETKATATRRIIDESSNEVKIVKRNTSKLGDRKITIAGKSYNLSSEASSAMQSILDRASPIDKSHGGGRIAKYLGIVRAFKFVGDASAFSVQLAYLGYRSPVRFAKTVVTSLRSTFGSPKAMAAYYRENAEVITEAANSGMLIGHAFEEIATLNEINETSGLGKRALKRTAAPFANVHTAAMNVGAIEVYKSMRKYGLDSDGKVIPKKMAEIARFADRASGRESLARNGVSSSAQAAASSLSAAPSMYMAFMNLMSDSVTGLVKGDSKQMHWEQSLKFLSGSTLLFMGQAMAAMMTDPEDDRSYDEMLLDAAGRLNPWNKEFMRIEIPIGDKRTVISQGGFFRAAIRATALGTAALKDGDLGGFSEAVYQFLGARKSPGVSAFIELATHKDYFGNRVTAAETITNSFVPIALQSVAANTRKTLFDILEENSPVDIDLNSKETILKEAPHLGDTVRELMLGVAGFSQFQENDVRKYKRQRNEISRDMFGEDYEGLTAQQKREATLNGAADGILKPKAKISGDYQGYVDDRFKKALGDKPLYTQLLKLDVADDVASIPSRNISFRKNEPKVQMGETEFKEANERYAASLKNYADSVGGELKADDVERNAKEIWGRELRSLGYPAPRSRR